MGTKSSIILNNNSKMINKTLNSLLFFYLKNKNKKKNSTILSKLPNLLSLQQFSFKHFLNIDISLAIEKSNPFKIEYKSKSFEIYYFGKYIRFYNLKKNLTKTINLNETYHYPVILPILIKFQKTSKASFEWIHIGSLPFMLKSGHFIINGISRIVLHQLIRIPGIYRLYYNKQTNKGIKKIPYIQIIPDKGNWITIYADTKNRIWISIKTLKKKLSLLVFLQALGFEIDFLFKKIRHSEILLSSVVPSLQSAETENVSRHDNILLNADLDVHPATRLEACKYIYAHFLEYSSLQKNKKTHKIIKNIKKRDAFNFFQQIIWNSRNRFLGVFCRKQIFQKLGVPISLNKLELTNDDFFYITQTIINLIYEDEIVDDIDDLTNKTIRGCGDFLYQELLNGLNESRMILNQNFEKFIKKRKKKKMKSFWEDNKKLIPLSITEAWNDFFVSGTLSQYLDETNPLTEITHKRRITFLGIGGITNQQATIKVRGIHPTYYGRICPIETPEGQNAGLVHSVTTLASKSSGGDLISPYFKVFKGQVQKNLGFFYLNREIEQNQISTSPDIAHSKWGLLSRTNFPIRQNLNFDFSSSYDVTIQSVSVLQLISLATSIIPFLEHDDANRALMGSNMQRQAVILLKPEVSLVKTMGESRVASDVNQIIQAPKSGLVFQVDSSQINIYKPKNIQNQRFFIENFLKKLKRKNFKYNSIIAINYLANFKKLKNFPYKRKKLKYGFRNNRHNFII